MKITLIYQECGDLFYEENLTEEALAEWMETHSNKAIVVRGEDHKVEDCT